MQTTSLAETRIRPAAAQDAEAIRAIYAHHVVNGTATFDVESPDTTFWEAKVGQLESRGWPFLVAEREGVVAGYAYATQFRDRAAYVGTCENSIYVADAMRGKGIGGQLLEALAAEARKSGFEQMIAVIGGGEPASVAVHGKAGFVHAGRMRNVGRKFGRLLDTVYMQRDLTA